MANTPVKAITIHCSASKPGMKVDAKVIERWHRERGFFKIGYHYVINRDGTVELGRSLDETGAHVQGFNQGNIGICLVGGLDEKGKPENNFTEQQFASLILVIKELLIKYPRAEIKGHRDWPGVKKDCPCYDVKKWWAAITDKELKNETSN
jgi:N-acetylmuramoyl-L-alanine amidase